MDEQQRVHLRDDLKGLIKGDLFFDHLSQALYSTDASIFQVKPLGVAVPRDEEDVQALVRYAGEHEISLIPRGAGTGVAGESLGTGLVIDLSRYFRSILHVGSDTVTVQPGVVYRDLNERLAREGRRFAPDPASGQQCTIGGMLANNSSGVHAFRHGYTRDHVVQLRVVLDTGDTALVGKEPRWPANDTPGHVHDIVIAVAGLLEENADLIRAWQPKTRFNRCGYLLSDILGTNDLDLARLLVGSEGTLGIFTEATLRTIPLPASRSLAFLGFFSLETALRAAQRCLTFEPVACELIDHRLLSLARSRSATVAGFVPPEAEVALLVEFESDMAGGAAVAVRELVDAVHRGERLAICSQAATEPEEMDRLWQLREMVLPSLYQMRGPSQPVLLVEDVSVPLENLSIYLRRVQELLQERETIASFLVHVGTGHVHTRPFLDLQKTAEVEKLRAIAEETHELALSLGGTVSAMHATGLGRTPWVARQYGPLYPILREIKVIFDPKGIFNPGKIIARPADQGAWPLRQLGEAQKDPSSQILRWEPSEVRREILNCNGCGQCRTEAVEHRMCPIFRATHDEAASPRAKANLMRLFLTEGEEAHLLSSDPFRAVADLCIGCKMCLSECPAQVNIPKLMLEAKAANVQEHGLDRTDWFLSRLDNWASLGSALALLCNTALNSRSFRWFLEKLFGLSRNRRLPAFSRRNFLRRAARRRWTRPPRDSRPRVAYFVDTFASYNDPLVGEATVAVLEHNGFSVYVPPGQGSSGMASLVVGDVETAREIAGQNVRVLADLAREGYAIICSEPTAAVVLRQDYPSLLEDPDVRLVSERVFELTSFLGDLHQKGQLKTDFHRLEFSVGHHVPCHIKALGGPPAGPGLLALIPGLRVHVIDVSCSGMAGSYGMKAENMKASLEAGRPMLQELSHPRVLFGSTECSSCRIQMEGETGKRTLHPVQYLALAYGLLPQIARRLREPSRGLLLR